MVEYLFTSIIIAVIGLAALTAFLYALLTRAGRRRELARNRGRITSQRQLDDLIRQVDQATTDDQLDRLEEKEND